MFTRTVEPKTLELLKKLMSLELFKDFRLVGGTALALQLGHRFSVDIDLFGPRDFDELQLRKSLESIGELKVTFFDSKNAINSCTLDGVKLDIIDYRYPWVGDKIVEEGIVMADLKDIAAMKLSAIGSRGSKKDFFDMYFLLQKFNLYEIVAFFRKKFNIQDVLHYIQGLGYFDDAQRDLDPIMFSKLSWEKVKAKIITEIQNIDFEKLV
ncbi:MAG: nucleotidyl transferase AbiEii/AbiGii toxin family protein [bacterium]